ncbi:plasmid partitioning protein RepB [Leisingera sp. JC1]|uniref:plasmid partitioning protein RepB n=1 Tax=Leisingera sp. JC1 TaxID=1855282 RepID=UPI0008037049|nr:plasmid partitioning protein RepB [Leisingera sp. JC1]OBY25677.1 plasmid partitioning protein RepB [Leisingera sp. JC1]
MKRDLLARSLQQMAEKKPADNSTAASPTPSKEGAPKSLKNMSDVLTQVASQSAQEIDVSEIADSEIADRFDVQDGLDDLVESIRDSGQELPVLVRYRRGDGPRYEVVYGRRRIAACRALGIKVKAFIKDMDLREALKSQALENSARLQRSFIEQAVFAAKLEQAGFTRQDICEALVVDKGTLSKLISVVRDVPASVIRAIGPARDSGRRPWYELRRLVTLENGFGEGAILEMIPSSCTNANERLIALIKAMQKAEAIQGSQPARRPPSPTQSGEISGGAVSFKAKEARITIQADKSSKAFIRFLEENLETIFSEWTQTRT